IIELDDAVAAVIDKLAHGEQSGEELAGHLMAHGIGAADAADVIEEMVGSHALIAGEMVAGAIQDPPADFPLQTLVLNLTNQCNLSCEYCYEFGEDKVATPEGKPKFMDFETAKSSVDFLLAKSHGRRA